MQNKTSVALRNNEEILTFIQCLISDNEVFIFTVSYCPYCEKLKNFLKSIDTDYVSLNVDNEAEMSVFQDVLTELTGQSNVPYLFIREQYIGGYEKSLKLHSLGKLELLLKGIEFDFDLVVIGGGSGGMAAAKEAAKDEDVKVALCDFVAASPHGTTWGLGGTCVNVGCIPKKLMHRASNFKVDFQEAPYFGWELASTFKLKHNWETMINNIQDYIRSLNFGCRKALTEKKIKYFNCFVEFTGPNTLKLTDKIGKTQTITSHYFIIAVGGRPAYPLGIPGLKEHTITSDDIFSLKEKPRKVLIVGASYVAMECAGFLTGLGCNVTVMVRSILLRGFDQEMAEMIGNHLKGLGVKFLRECIPVQVIKLNKEVKMIGKFADGQEYEENFNQVIIATGRTAQTDQLNVQAAKIKIDFKTRKIITDQYDQSNIPNIFAIGDVAFGKPELTPVAIQAGILVARRVFYLSTELMNYNNIPTTIFTPLEYGCVGLSEEKALELYGTENVEVYHSHFQPLEYALSKRDDNKFYAKLICIKPKAEKLVGFHILSPNAGEITQGFAFAFALKATKLDMDRLVGIHPTCAEIMTTLTITKSSGINLNEKSC